MDSIKVAGKTVEDALTEASIQLGTSSDNIEYTVIDEGSKGFFGIGGRKAVIEARKKVTDEDLMKEIFDEKPEKPVKEYKQEIKKEKKEPREAKEVKAQKDSREVKENREQKKDFKESKETKEIKEPKGVREAKDPKETKEAREPKGAREVKEAKEQKEAKATKDSLENKETREAKASREAREIKEIKEIKETKEVNGTKETKEVNGAKEARSTRDKREANGTRDTRENKEIKDQKKELKDKDIKERKKEADKEVKKNDVPESGEEIRKIEKDEAAVKIPKVPADPEEAKKRAREFISEIFRAMGMDVEITAEFEDGILCVDIEGEDMGIMIGKRGQTLDALQYLTSLVVNRGKAAYVRVKVDTEDYRNRRKATLENLAKNIAYKVRKTRKPVFLEPMNPYERRIIHSALQNDPYVTTHSEGDEPYRRVVVTLRKDHEKGHGYSRYNNNHKNEHYDQKPVRKSTEEYDYENSEEYNGYDEYSEFENSYNSSFDDDREPEKTDEE